MAATSFISSVLRAFGQLFLAGFGALLATVIFYPVYNLFFHPLRKYPGPLLHRATVLGKARSWLNGTLPHDVSRLHHEYGPVVRIAPNELSFVEPEAMRDIYGRAKGKYEIPQDDRFYNALDATDRSVIELPREEHDAVRKLMATGFSDRSLRAQEPVITGYVDLLVTRLREKCSPTKSVNIRDYINFTTFDIIGQLSFGSDFGCLEGGDYHPWVALIINSVRDLSFILVLELLGIVRSAVWLMNKLQMGAQSRKLHNKLTDSKTRQRVEMGTGRDDFLDTLIQTDMSFNELKKNAGLLIIAGSETTATLLTGCVYFLTANPDILDKLQKEVRGHFTSEDQINLTTVNELPYMLAVLNESLRCYPPVPFGMPRRVPQEGSTIAGRYVPGGSLVAVWQYAVSRDRTLFADALTFDPERFLHPKEGKYAADRLDASNPFLVGPRNCLGQTLAYVEMKLILSRLVWNFDMKLCDSSKGWLDHKNFIMWDKPPLEIYLQKAER